MRLAHSLLPAVLLLGATPCLAASTAEIKNQSFYSLTIAIGSSARGVTYKIGSQSEEVLEPGGSFTIPGYASATLTIPDGEKAFTLKDEQEEGIATLKDTATFSTEWKTLNNACRLIDIEAKGKAVTITKR
jgi:hypothetical protein